MWFRGAVNLKIGAAGELVASVPGGKLMLKQPKLYETGQDGSRREVFGGYRLLGGGRAVFVAGRHGRRRPLLIDPVLVSAKLLGGSNDSSAIAADPRAAIVGTTASADFPGVETARHRGLDIFVYDPNTGSTSIIGGSGDDIATCAKIFPAPPGGLVIGGYTNSPDFPVTLPQNTGFSVVYAPQAQFGGGDWDGFLLTLNSATSGQPVFATYLGGSGDDRVLGIDSGNYSFGAIAAVGSTTSTDFPVANAWQPQLGGGVDGFLTLYNVFGSSTPAPALVALSSYLGGSGDDRALAVGASAPLTDLYIGGVTASADWQSPGSWTGSLTGPSDGFLLHMTNGGQAGSSLQPAQGLFFGGSGNDRITGLTAMPSGDLGIAGTTSSSDLEVMGGPQTMYGGGASDAFIAAFSPDLQTLRFATFFGGSGADEALAITANRFDELLVGGWTNSADFPVSANPVSSCGNGPDDGFLVHLDARVQVVYATCYGGSGSDRITAVATDGGQYDYAGGFSNSADLPLQGAPQTANTGSIDGFQVTFTAPVIHADGLTVGKDLRGTGLALLGDPSNSVGTPLTVTSGDPTRVLLAIRPDDGGQASVTIANGTSNLNGMAVAPAARTFLVYCLADNGTVGLALTAPGYPAQTVNVRCVPSGLLVDSRSVVSLAGGGGWISVVPAAFDPNTGHLLAVQNPRGGLDPIAISVVNPAPDLLTFLQTTVLLDGYSDLSGQSANSAPVVFQFRTSRAGTADVTFTTTSSFSFVPSNVTHVIVSAPALSLYVPPLARDLSGQISLGWNVNASSASPIQVTMTSSDPSKARITTDPTADGQGSVTVTVNGLLNPVPVWVELLDTSGSVSITASAPGLDPVTVPVVFGQLMIGWFDGNAQPLVQSDVLPGQSLNALIRPYVVPVTMPSGYFDSRYRLRAGTAPLQVSVQSTGANVATPASASVPLAAPGQPWSPVSFPIQAQTSPGTAVYSIQVAYGSARSAGTLEVDVTPPALSLDSATIGYNLMVPVYLRPRGRSGNGTVNATLIVSDPSKALLSSDAQTAGQPSISVPVYYQTTVYVHAIAGSGSVDVTAAADSFASAKTTFTLAPSGFAWTTPTASVPSPNGSDPMIAAYALDSTTMTAFARQSVRPGLTGTVGLQNSDSTVASLGTDSLPLASFDGGQSVKIKSAGGGDAQIGITQPPGFTPPAARGPLRLKVARPSIAFQPLNIGKNTEAPLGVSPLNTVGIPPATITLTSGDPSKLLFSADQFNLGGPTATVSYQPGPPAASYGPVYVQALDGPADVTITASAPGWADSSSFIPIMDTALSIAQPYGIQQVTVNTQQDPVQFSVGVANGLTLRPGLDPIPVTINNSNAAAATVPAPPILNSLTSMATFRLKPLASGQTDLTLVPPPGFVMAPPNAGRTLHVTVKSPSFVINDFVLGMDLQTAVNMSLQNGASSIPADVDVTLTSSDPRKVVLSADPATPGAAALTVHFAQGSQPSRTIYAQALDQSGQAIIAIAANGYASTTANVTLVPTTFASDQTTVTAQLQTGATVRYTPVPLVNPALQYYGSNFQFRPGLAGVPVTFSTSNPGVATVSLAAATWQPGSRELDAPVQLVSAGMATLTMAVPGPYVAPPPVNVTVTGGNLLINLQVPQLGKDLQATIGIFGDGFNLPVPVTLTSSDPTRLLVSSSPTSPGQATANLVSQPGQPLLAYVQALAGSGSVTVTISAPGYQNATATIQLAPAAVVLSGPQQVGTLTPLSAPLPFQARLGPPYASPPNVTVLRPGATPVTVQAMVSDPTVATAAPTQLTFSPGDSTQSFSVQPTAAGVAVVSVSVPDGFADPVGGREQLLTIVAARIVFNGPLTVGKDLARSLSLALPAATGQALTVTLTSSDPSRLLLSNSSAMVGTSSVTVVVPAASSGGETFSLIGRESSGTVTLNLTAPPLAPSSYTVTLEPSGFVFGIVPTDAEANSTITLPILPWALSPQTLAPDANLASAPGLAPVSVNVTSSNTAVSGPASVSFSPGNTLQYVTILLGGAGTTTFSIQAPPGFATPSSGAAATINVH
jgi:hypothetical protein